MKEKYKIRTSKEGIIITSDMTGVKYRVTKWEELGDGKIRAIEKERIT